MMVNPTQSRAISPRIGDRVAIRVHAGFKLVITMAKPRVGHPSGPWSGFREPRRLAERSKSTHSRSVSVAHALHILAGEDPGVKLKTKRAALPRTMSTQAMTSDDA